MITIHSSELLRALRRVAPIVPAKTPVPIMSCIALRASGGTATFAATDSHRSIRTSVPCDGDLAVALPAKTLANIAASLPAGDVVVELVPGGASIRAGRARFKVPSMPIEDFPPLHATTGDLLATMPAAALGDLLRSVQHAVADDSTRPHLAGVNLEFGDGLATATATDGHRLSTSSTPCEAVAPGTLVPVQAVDSIVALCLDRDEAVGVVLLRSERHVIAERGDTSIMSVLVDAVFPPWRKIMPPVKRKGARASVSREALADAVRRVSLVARRDGGLRLDVAEGVLKLSALDSESGESSEDIEAITSGGDGFVGLCGSYLSDALRSMQSEHVEVGLAGELEPIVVRDGVAERTSASVIMPMRA